MTAMRTAADSGLDSGDGILVGVAQGDRFWEQVIKRREYAAIQPRLDAAFRDRQRAMVLARGFDYLEPAEHVENLFLRVKLVHRRVFLVRLDWLAAQAMNGPHPRRAPVKMRDDCTTAGPQDPVHFVDCALRVA